MERLQQQEDNATSCLLNNPKHGRLSDWVETVNVCRRYLEYKDLIRYLKRESFVEDNPPTAVDVVRPGGNSYSIIDDNIAKACDQLDRNEADGLVKDREEWDNDSRKRVE